MGRQPAATLDGLGIIRTPVGEVTSEKLLGLRIERAAPSKCQTHDEIP
jgi:hypothetical protein